MQGRILGGDQNGPKPGPEYFIHLFLHGPSEHSLNVYHVPESPSPIHVVEGCRERNV